LFQFTADDSRRLPCAAAFSLCFSQTRPGSLEAFEIQRLPGAKAFQ
jgi:hypothetical protein